MKKYGFVEYFQDKITNCDNMIRLCEACPEGNKQQALEWVLQRDLLIETYHHVGKEIALPKLNYKNFSWTDYFKGTW